MQCIRFKMLTNEDTIFLHLGYNLWMMIIDCFDPQLLKLKCELEEQSGKLANLEVKMHNVRNSVPDTCPLLFCKEKNLF